MDEPSTTHRSALRIWLKRVGIGIGVLVLLLVVLHRPLLQVVGRRAAIHFAAKENLKLDFRLEGSILTNIVLRNVHVVATGPSAVQTADVDFVRVDYSLWSLITVGMAELLKNVEVRNATVVLDPKKAPPQIDVEKDKKFTVPAFFPDRLLLSDVNVRLISEPRDLIIEHLTLELNPTGPGELRIAKVQIPNGREWTKIAASTSYEGRNLFLRDLVLDDKTRIAVVNLDASRVAANALDVKVEGVIAGAKISTSIALGEKETAMNAGIDFVAEDISLEALTRYIDPPDLEGADVDGPEIELAAKESLMRGDVRRLAIKGSGQLERPKSWSGSVVGTIDNLAAGGVVFDSAAIDISAADGVATIRAVELKQGPSNISLRGTAELPETLDGFGRSPASIELRGVAPDLGAITAGMAQPIAGSAEVNGRVNIRDARINADLSIAAGPIDFGKGTVQKAIVNIRATKQMPPEEQERPYFEGLTSEIGLDVTDVRASGFAIDAVAGEVRTNGQNVTIEQLIVNRRDNRITMRGQYLLPMDFALAASQPGAVELSLVAANVGDYWESEDAPARVTGALQLWVQTDLRGGVGDGSFSVYGANLRARNMVIPELSASGSTAGNVVYLNDLTASLNARDYIRANGTAGINAPHDYSGSLALNIADLGTFESLLETAGKKTDLAGALAINWQGSGSVSNFKNTGSLKLTLDDGRYANLDNLEANVDANYTPDELNVPIIFVSSDKLMFQAIMQAKGETLEVTKLEVVQGQAKYGSGYVSVPFIWANVGSDRPLFPTGGKVLVNFQTENLDINKLGKDFGTEIPVKGLANVKLDADGTIDDLRATLALQLTGLQSEKLEDFTPATFGMNARIENKQLVIDGKLEQARISPIAITANLPLDVAKIVQNKKIDEGTPVRAKVQMPRSSVNFVRQFVPALQRIDGNAALDVNIGGTIADPTFSGAADMTINAARFSNATLPALTNFNARLVFDGNALTFPQFRGELAGGPFTVSGRITFPKLTEPTFDLQLRADAVLVARNDDMTVRVDANVSVVGPLAGATVAGNIGITNSQFLKNLDLIPIGMPGRPPPAPKPPAASPTLSFPEPPLRDWKFDLVIKTKDPFMIRGNLANGGALVDMRISGTGLEPKIDGSVRLQNVEATLPFSRLEISQGFLYFNPNDPMNPGLDLQGTSIIRDYTIRVYVYGTADSPEAVFTSEPPLPQEEIISLLATGTTREELLGGGNVLAGRALMLLGQQLYQKVFKKGQAASTNSVFDRLQVDVGNVDPRTGQQTATARYRVTDKVLVIGDIGVQGDFRGTVKYLIRFR